MKSSDIDKVNERLGKLKKYNDFLDDLDGKDMLFVNEIEMEVKSGKANKFNFSVFGGMFKERKGGIVKYILKEIRDMRDNIISDLKHMGVDYEG